MRRFSLRLLLTVPILALIVLAAPSALAQDPTPTPAPTSIPAPTATPAPPAPTTTTHTVQPGENLYRISLRYGVTVQALAQINGIRNPNLIFVGQVLNISGGTTPPPAPATPAPGTPPPATGGTIDHVVARGETLSAIARRYNTTVQAIAQANNIANVNLIFAGQVLKIVAGSGTTPPPATPPPGGTPPPVTGGGFELGGHVANFGNMDAMRSAGMTWAKVQIRWKRGQNPDITAPAINDAHLNGFKILLGIVGDKNEMASMSYEAYTDEFAAFLGGVARLGPEAIEIWNEPNLDREWPNGQINPANYTIMLRKGYQAIKAINPNILVISGAPAPTGAEGAFGLAAVWNDDRYIRGMAQAGAAQFMDCIGAHYNEGIVGPNQRSGDPRDNYYSRYYGTMFDLYTNTFGNARPLCWTELGYMTPEGFSVGAPPGFEWGNNNSLAEQSQWLGEAARLARQSGRVRLMIVWNVNFTSTAPDPSGMFAIVRPNGQCNACANLQAALR